MQVSKGSHQATDSYSLTTAAYNEESIIEQTIQSIVAQSLRPRK